MGTQPLHRPNAPTNSSSVPALAQLPASLLDKLIPGYGTISPLFLDQFGFDISIIVAICCVAFTLMKSFEFLSSRFMGLLIRYGTCSVQVDSDNDPYDWVRNWLSDRGIGNDGCRLEARPSDVISREDGEIVQQARAAVKYEASMGQIRYFWYKSRLFMWVRGRPECSTAGRDATIEGRLYCLSLSPEPIKNLIADAYIHNHEKTKSEIGIRHPYGKHKRRWMDNLWGPPKMKLKRKLESVVLDDEQKANLIADLEEFLESRSWYAERGIPYRRGYVRVTFHLFDLRLHFVEYQRGSMLTEI